MSSRWKRSNLNGEISDPLIYNLLNLPYTQFPLFLIKGRILDDLLFIENVF